jgi:putative membrane protein
MARKLLRFSTLLAVPALGLGLWLWLGYGIGKGQHWLAAKLFFVLLAVGYHGMCAVLLRRFEAGSHRHGHVWYRWFNEAPVLLMLAIVVLAVVKPF